MSRPTWADTWMAVAETIALRSRCDGRQIGAVIVDATNRPIATGYNGPPAHYLVPDEQTCQSFCPRIQTGSRTLDYSNCVSIHAEANALLFADRRDYAGGSLYVTSTCCWDCGKLIANSGLKQVYIPLKSYLMDEHRDPARTTLMLRNCGIDVVYV